MEFLTSRLKSEDVQKMRFIAEGLVDESGIDMEFPKETQRLGIFDILLMIFRILSILMGLFIAWLLIVNITHGGSWFEIILSLIIFVVYPTCTYGLIIIIPVVIFYADEQEKLRDELKTLIAIAETSIFVLRDQNRKDVEFEINRAEKLIEEYRKNKL